VPRGDFFGFFGALIKRRLSWGPRQKSPGDRNKVRTPDFFPGEAEKSADSRS
jgi:hypothetical protein